MTRIDPYEMPKTNPDRPSKLSKDEKLELICKYSELVSEMKSSVSTLMSKEVDVIDALTKISINADDALSIAVRLRE